MKTLAMLQNPSAKLTGVDPSVAQHYHDKLLEARREKAHVRRTLCVLLGFVYPTLQVGIMQKHQANSFKVTVELKEG